MIESFIKNLNSSTKKKLKLNSKPNIEHINDHDGGNLPSTTSARLMHPALCIAWRVCDKASVMVGFFSFNFSYSRNKHKKQALFESEEINNSHHADTNHNLLTRPSMQDKFITLSLPPLKAFKTGDRQLFSMPNAT